MAEVAKLVGMEVRQYTGNDGRQRQFCGLHLIHVENTVRSVKGCNVEAVSCPCEIDPSMLELGTTYQMDAAVS